MDTVKNKTKGPRKNYRAEAMRYVENARECLLKAGKDGDYYSDPKYVKMAGNALWNGVLLALKAKFPVKGRPDIQKYQQAVGAVNRSKLKVLNAAYELCHLFMGYDGHLKFSVCQEGTKLAIELIEWAAPE
jgi:hypothetical protein